MRPRRRRRVTTHRLWIVLLATVALTTLILAGSAVAQNSTALKVCLPNQYGKLKCNTTTDSNGACLIGNATCDQIAQQAANGSAEDATQDTAPPATPTAPVYQYYPEYQYYPI
jgi:hypothetical protein